METFSTLSALKLRKAPVILRTFADGQWGGPVYLQKGDEVTVRIREETYIATFHGAGWLGDKLITRAADLLEALPAVATGELADSIGANLRGSLCLYLHTHDTFHAFPDPLGAAMLYEYRSPRVWAHSSDLEALIEAVTHLGEEPKKSLEYLVEVIATGNGGFFPASYEDVATLPPFAYVSIDDMNSYQGSYHCSDAFFARPSNIADLFEEARSDLIQNVRAVAASGFGHRISHLTGGFDSRLILSAMMHEHLHDEFKFMCSGNTQMPDRRIAGELCGHVGIPLTNSDGTIKRAYAPGNAMFGTFGMLRSDLPESALPDHVLMSGGYGECLRSFYGARNAVMTAPEATLQAIHGRTFAAESRMLGPDFYATYVDRFKDFSAGAVSDGLPRDAVLDYMYAAKRNRYYVGLTSEYHSNMTPRVDPIYSVAAVKLGLFTPQAERAGNVQGLKMMASLQPELVGLPFDSDRITPTYESLHGPVTRTAFNGRQPRFIQDDRITVSPSKPATKEQIQRAQEIKGSLLQIVHLQDVQAELKKLLAANRASISKVMDWTIVNRFLNPNLSNRNHIRTVFTMHDSLRWYTA
ncbi:hypothetical protein CQ050_13640 [Achromobacter sp. MYb9]|uniref:hypothetical protein n=1 Tax=Achromobacter sp. MYb9 TaxID=1827284 RepID=UPI000CFAB19D|nr:hypothetical protein [Achromobacter sp. MYb9]PQZ68292.1 hypothetical protein CQ050_13640 [Achromobacter sp. MYb9]